MDGTAKLKGPSPSHLFGTDNFGRDGKEWIVIKGGCANEIVTDSEIDRKRIITSNDKLPFLGFRLVEEQ